MKINAKKPRWLTEHTEICRSLKHQITRVHSIKTFDKKTSTKSRNYAIQLNTQNHQEETITNLLA